MADNDVTGEARRMRFGVVAPIRTELPAWRDQVRRIADSGYSTILMPDVQQWQPAPGPTLAVAATLAPDLRAEPTMRTLKIIEHVSLDGVVQHTADENEFPYSEWNSPYRTPDGRDAVMAAHGDRFDLLLGRRTYDLWSAFWPTAPSSPLGDRLNAATKYVATHRPESLDWGPSEAVGPDLIEDVRRIKTGDGPGLVLSGSSTLTSTLLEHGLAEEVLLIVYPVLLGTGKRIFAEGTPARSLELADTKTTSSGVILATYRATGQLNPRSAATRQVRTSCL